MKGDFVFAKVVLASSFFTLILIGGIGFIFRHPLSSYFSQFSSSEAATAFVTEDPTKDEELVPMIREANEAVVSVVVIKDVLVYERYYEPSIQNGLMVAPRVREQGTQEQEVGGGSGFIVSNDGLIVTNNHVISDESARYSVILNNGMRYTTSVIARDAGLDIAILKISEPIQEKLTYLEFGDSSQLALGQTAVAIGNALGEFQNSVSVGVISGLSRSITASDEWGRNEQLHEVIQTDAAINAGNSGGPLLNLKGEVIGVNVATSRGADNIGFALPAQVVAQVVTSVKEYGEIVRPFLGVRYTMLTPRIVKNNNLPVQQGALVTRGQNQDEVAVSPGSPAAIAGVLEGDIIVSIDGVLLETNDLSTLLRTKEVGQEVSLHIVRGSEEKTIGVTLVKAP